MYTAAFPAVMLPAFFIKMQQKYDIAQVKKKNVLSLNLRPLKIRFYVSDQDGPDIYPQFLSQLAHQDMSGIPCHIQEYHLP